jgi:hypothetical protein
VKTQKQLKLAVLALTRAAVMTIRYLVAMSSTAKKMSWQVLKTMRILSIRG